MSYGPGSLSIAAKNAKNDRIARRMPRAQRSRNARQTEASRTISRSVRDLFRAIWLSSASGFAAGSPAPLAPLAPSRRTQKRGAARRRRKARPRARMTSRPRGRSARESRSDRVSFRSSSLLGRTVGEPPLSSGRNRASSSFPTHASANGGGRFGSPGPVANAEAAETKLGAPRPRPSVSNATGDSTASPFTRTRSSVPPDPSTASPSSRATTTSVGGPSPPLPAVADSPGRTSRSKAETCPLGCVEAADWSGRIAPLVDQDHLEPSVGPRLARRFGLGRVRRLRLGTPRDPGRLRSCRRWPRPAATRRPNRAARHRAKAPRGPWRRRRP